MPKQDVETEDDDRDNGADNGAGENVSEDGKPKPKGRSAGKSTVAVAPANPAFPVEKEKVVIDQVWTARARETQEALDAQPKVRIMIPLQNGEPIGSIQEFNINGYRLTVRKNVMVDVPEQIAQMIAERYNIELTAGQEMRADRPKAGLSEALS